MYKNKLKEYRKQNHLTQREISRFTGIHVTTIGNIERMKSKPCHRVKRKIAALFCVKQSMIFP
jgi:DNA-binding XRE family transcriptional regulator